MFEPKSMWLFLTAALRVVVDGYRQSKIRAGLISFEYSISAMPSTYLFFKLDNIHNKG